MPEAKLGGFFPWFEVVDLLRNRPRSIGILGLATVLAGLSESGVLAVLAQTAAALVDRSKTVHVDLGSLQLNTRIGTLLLVGILLALLRLALQGVLALVPARIVSDTQARLRGDLFVAFTHASWEIQSRDREGYLQELLTNQVTQAMWSTVAATTLIISIVTFAVLVASALALNVLAALLVLVSAGALSLLLRPLSSLGQRAAELLSHGSARYAGGVSEAVRLAEEAHVFGAAPSQRRLIAAYVEEIRRPYFQTQLITRLVPGTYQGLVYLLVLAALVALNAAGTSHIASLGAVVLLLIRAGAYGQQAQGSIQALRQAQPFMDRVRAAARRYAAEADHGAEGRPLPALERLSFEDVSFTYGRERAALSDVSFDVRGGEAVGVVGPSGAGKSTLVQILLGLREPSSGQYLVNDRTASEFDRDDWRRCFAYVPQEPRLLHASVAANIRFFRPLGDDSVERAARLAGIHDEVVQWPEGYATIVGPRADAISGGQQQRICLARALAARPEVLVLDEPTSALDPHAEQLIQQSLLALKGALTLFIVAHRMSTLDICERVMVIVNGRLEAFADAAELRATNAYYRSAVSTRSVLTPHVPSS